MPEKASEIPNSTFSEVMQHYQLATEDLDIRRRQFDKVDELFFSHIDEDKWPYQSLVFDPRIYTILFEKTSRLVGNKLRGKLVPREGGDVKKAKILNELLSFQWDEVTRLDQQSMVERWAKMDLNARKYGASFGMVKWHYETRDKPGNDDDQVYFDGPVFVPLNNRDCLPNPSYSTIKNWFQHREYVTLSELERINDAAQEEPTYKNLDKLRAKLEEETDENKGGVSDTRSSNYVVKSKEIRGVDDTLGRDPAFKVIEIVHEYRTGRWITFAPNHGVVIRDIDNPYDHGQIPVVMLKYYPVDDDLYGLSEVEPIESLQKAINAAINQYLDTLANELYKPLMVNPQRVQLHTLEYGPAKKWYMQNPGQDVQPFETSSKSAGQFNNTYSMLVAALNNAMGSSSVGTSNIDRFNPDKTATEVRAIETQKNVRDNFNQIFLSKALERQMSLWYLMDQQFILSDPDDQQLILRVTGRDSIETFKALGYADMEVPPEALELLLEDGSEEDISDIELQGRMDEMKVPKNPVRRENEEGITEQVPKFQVDETGEVGELVVVPEDLTGNYDFKADVESMAVDEDGQMQQARNLAVQFATNPNVVQLLQQRNVQINIEELLTDFLENNGLKDAEKFFEQVPQQQNVPEQGGQITPEAASIGTQQSIPNTEAINEQ